MMLFEVPFLLVIMLVSLGLGALGALLAWQKDELAHLWGSLTAAIGSAAAILTGASVLSSGEVFSWEAPTSFLLLHLALKIDTLAAFFLIIIGTIALLATIYGVSYLRQFYGHYRLSSFLFFYNIFVGSLFLVITAEQALYFLLVWEIMSLSSYFLVIFEHREDANRRAGLKYFVMTHVATTFISLMFLTLYAATGSLRFADFTAGAAVLPVGVASVVFLLALLGFGTKAGVIPLHIWLPDAHPAAPASISALMSGVMIKTGIFMLLRVCFEWLPIGPVWWGVVVLMLGALSSLLGVLYALAEHDIKRLLAYHSVENIGIILLGMGSGLIFVSLGQPALALVGLLGALYHTMNHAIFKTLLFFGAGAVVSATGTKNMEEYGGLIKRMPYTAGFFLVGCLAISGIVPFNGFASEWLIFQSLFAGLGGSSSLLQGSFILAIAALAFTGGLAAACFVKAFGVTFLARPRSVASERAVEAKGPMVASMSVLAALCLALGVWPSRVVVVLQRVASVWPQFTSDALAVAPNMITVREGFGGLSMWPVFVGLVAAVAVGAVMTGIVSRRQRVRLGATWNCGTPLTPRMEMSATAFSRSLIIMWRGVLRSTKQTEVEYLDAQMRYFARSRTVTMELLNIYSHFLYRPAARLLFRLSHQTKRIQSGNVNMYLLYIFVTLCALLLWATA